MTNQNNAPQSTIDPMYRNLARGETPLDKSKIILSNTVYIEALCDLIEAFDTSISDEPVVNTIALIQRLNREISLNQAGLHDYLKSVEHCFQSVKR